MKVMARNLLLTISTVVFVAGIGYAKFWNFSSSRGHNQATIEVPQTSKLSTGAELKPGNYEVRVTVQGDQAMVGFYQLNKLVAQVPATLEKTSQKFERTELYYNTPSGQTAEMTSMELSGWHRKIVLNSVTDKSGS